MLRIRIAVYIITALISIYYGQHLIIITIAVMMIGTAEYACRDKDDNREVWLSISLVIVMLLSTACLDYFVRDKTIEEIFTKTNFIKKEIIDA